MFVRVNTTPNSPRKSVQIVESKRDGHKVRTKILRHVGIAMNDEELGKLKSLAYDIIAKIKEEAEKQSSLFPELVVTGEMLEDAADRRKAKRGRPRAKELNEILPVEQVTLDMIVEEKRIIEGISDCAGLVYDQLGFNNLLKSKKEQKMLKSLVLSRLAEPSSKLRLQKILSEKYDQDYDLDAIYRLMDRIFPQIDKIKQIIFRRTQNLFPQGVNLLLFDVTTLYFESTDTDELRSFGYSKDHRFNTTQLVLALATNAEGLPIAYELFAGNTAEVSTLCAAIDKWKKTLPIGEVCFVGDRAMFSRDNLALLDSRGYTYVVAAKLRNLPKSKREEILNLDNYRMAAFKNESGLIGEFELDNRRLIASYKPSRAKNDEKNRERIIAKINKNLAQDGSTKKLISNHGVKKYTTTKGDSFTFLDEDKIDKDAAWDGIHGVITNIKDWQAEDVLAHYARLWKIEESFRINKHTLKMRPIYHFKESRIKAHIALCYMSFAVLRNLQYQVNLTQKVSVHEIIDELLNTQASIYVHKTTGDRYRVPGKTSHKASKIYKAFNLVRSQDATIYLP